MKMNFSAFNSSSWKAESVLISAGFSVIFLLGTLGNSLVLAVLSRNGQMNTKTTNLFILNLGIADLCFILFCVPFQATIYTLDQWVFGPVLCKVVHFIIFLTMYASIFTLTAVSLDRCVFFTYDSFYSPASCRLHSEDDTLLYVVFVFLYLHMGSVGFQRIDHSSLHIQNHFIVFVAQVEFFSSASMKHFIL